MKLLKLMIILAVGAASLFTAVYFTEKYVAEMSLKETTLAEAILKSKLEAQLKEAEEEAASQLGEALVTTVQETLPPKTEPAETEPPETTAVTTEAVTTAAETVTEAEEDIVTEFTRGGILPENKLGLPIKTMFTLTESEQLRLTDFLVEYYFLDGSVYAENETRPALKEKKQLAYEMESAAVEALNLVMTSITLSDVQSVMNADYASLKSEITAIRDNFESEYSNAADHGEEFESLYNDSLRYLTRLIKAIEHLEETADEYAASTNPLLAALILASAVEDVILPEILAVLEESFDLVETSQEIFLEGTQGKKLLSRDEVTQVIINPALALDTGLA